MAGRKSDFTLPTLDDLFSTQEQRDEEKLSKIRDIPLTEIDDFPDHPFKVRDDEDMAQLVESIKERGVITPATVRQKEDGRYELVSGHRRKRACELAGFDTLRCEVVDLTRDEATILMVEGNYQSSQILPSEKAFAYKMRNEAMKRQAGRPSKENVSPVGTNLRTDEIIAQECGDSRNQIHRYIRLTNLVPELLEYVDEGQKEYLAELLQDENNQLWSQVLYGIGYSDGQIVTVALSQVGNVGGQPYWSWYGFDSRVEWCACFVSWCANECGYIDSGIIPKYAGCVNGAQWFKDRGQWADRNYEPAPGTIIFFDWEGDGVTDHTGIVQKCENGTVYTVEGNSGDTCRTKTYPVRSSVGP